MSCRTGQPLITFLPTLFLRYADAVFFFQVLHPGSESININKDIWAMYFDNLLPELAAEGDDGNYGSTATLDVLCLQVLLITSKSWGV